MVGFWWLALITGGVGCIWFYKRWNKLSRLPPGPKSWPLVGNAFQQDPGHPYLTWSKWADKYGDVLTVNNFGTPVVLCNSSKSLWEMLISKSNDFAGRPARYPSVYISDGARDLGSGDFDSHWMYRKKVFMSCTKMYGDGVERLETIMQDVVRRLLEDFQKTKQEPFDPMKPIQLALCNTLALLLLGDKFDYSDPDFISLIDYVEQCDQIISQSVESMLIASFPWLHYIPLPFCRLMDSYVNGFMKGWLPKMIRKRKAKYDEDNLSCVMDAFIKQHESDLKTDPQHVLEMRHIIALSENMFMAGMLTSTSTMYIILALLTVKQDIQDKVQEEIDQVLRGRQPKVQDRQSMPYFQAMFEEVLRYAVVVNGLPHKATTDSSICGHFIPKGTQVWPNVWHLCHDPEVYEDPWTFKPERFLDDNGKFLSPDHPARKNVLIFGAGRRICPGEQLARNRIFLLTTSILQNFALEAAAGNQLPQSDPRTFPPGIAIKPEPYNFRAIPRVVK